MLGVTTRAQMMTQRRNRRSGVEDRWIKRVRDPDGTMSTVPSAVAGRGMRWRARYVGPDGKEYSKRFGRKADAQAWLDKTTTEVGTHTWVDPSRSRELFAPMAEAWFATKVSKKPKTTAGYRSILDVLVLPRWGEMRLSDIAYEDVQTWITGLSVHGGARFERGLSPSRVVQTYQVLNMVLKYAIRAKRLMVNPAIDVELPSIGTPEKQYLTHQQVQELAVACGRFRTLTLVLSLCGLRFGEGAALVAGSVDLKAARIWVKASATQVAGHGIVKTDTKTREDRKVPIPTMVVELLRTELPSDPDALVFPGKNGSFLSLGEYRWAFDRAVRTVQATTTAQRQREIAENGELSTPKFPTITPHSLRHTTASLAVQAGANIKVLQTLMGHKTATLTLDRYGHLYPDDLGAIGDALDRGARSAAASLRTEAAADGGPGLQLVQ
jgi:integrase